MSKDKKGKVQDSLGFGVIGCGVIAPWHLNGVQKSPHARLVAVCDTDRRRAEERSLEFRAERVYTDHRQMLEDPEVQVVTVCVPSGLHGTLALDAMRAGRHVLVEKPLEITLEKIDQMIACARQSGVKLGCIFQRRTSPLWQAVHDTITSGKIGRLLIADAYLKYYRDQAYYDSAGWRGTWAVDGGGALMNQGVHCIDLIRWVAGEPDSVFARCARLDRQIEVEDSACAVVTYKSGALGVIEGTTCVLGGIDHRVEFHGDRGNICIEGDKIVKWETTETNEPPEGLSGGASGVASTNTAIALEGHEIQINDFALAVLEDRSPMITGAEARKAVELILGIYRSGEKGEVVRFPLA